MPILTITAGQEAVLDAMDTKMDDAFEFGVATTPVIAGYKGYGDLAAEYQTLTKDAFKIVFATYLAASGAGTYDTPVLASGWTSSVVPFRAWVNGAGDVRVDGVVQGPASPGANPIMFTLNPGFRPDRTQQCVCSYSAANSVAVLMIDTLGVVRYLGTPSPSAQIQLNIIFKAA